MLGGRLHLLNGGTELIDSPRAYSAAALGFAAEKARPGKSPRHEQVLLDVRLERRWTCGLTVVSVSGDHDEPV
jgi:hypothetical protein